MIAALILSVLAAVLLAAIAAPLVRPEPITAEPAPPTTRRRLVAVPLPYASPDDYSAVRERLLIAHVHLSLFAAAWRLPAALPAPVFAGAPA